MTRRKSSDRGKNKPAVAALPPLPPRAAMESVLAMFGGGGRRGTPLDQAQDLMYQAWEASSPARRVALARQALEISPDCADAYVLLVQYSAGGLAESIALLREGVAAGQRALGKRAFKDDVGSFWGLLDTRPYMRARAGLAQLLREAGQHEEAVAHYRDLLRLNPNDNQGLRYELAACLLDLGLDEDLAALLGQYHDDCSATWAYSAALLAFRKGGDDADARQLLVEAKKTNPHVPAYLLGKKKLPRRLPDYIGMGDENEAVVYAISAVAGWKKAVGALDWLRLS
jgi:tetratricopeptide (TPR) repeat protein